MYAYTPLMGLPCNCVKVIPRMHRRKYRTGTSIVCYECIDVLVLLTISRVFFNKYSHTLFRKDIFTVYTPVNTPFRSVKEHCRLSVETNQFKLL